LTPDVTQAPPLRRISLTEVEKEHIAAVLNAEHWNMQKSADILGIHRNTLRQKSRIWAFSHRAGVKESGF